MQDTDSIVLDFAAQFRTFMDTEVRNAWLYVGNPRAAGFYIRKSLRRFDDGAKKFVNAVDMANFAVMPKFRRRGIFSAVMNIVEAASEYVYVENVLGEDLESQQWLIRVLLRRGYTEYGSDAYAPCFIKRRMA